MKIIHISDLHLCHTHKKINFVYIKTIFDYIVSINPDHVVITGDISDNSRIEDFETLRKTLLEYDLLRPEKLSIVIGNHDIFGTVQRIEDIISFPEKCKKTIYKEKVNEFCQYFHEAFNGSFQPSDKSVFPFAKELRDYILLGINSVQKYSKTQNPFASNGKVINEEIESLNIIFNKKEFKERKKIILIHHHFYKDKFKFILNTGSLWQNFENHTMKLRKKKKLLNLFKESRVELVLHGHYHESKGYFIKGILFSNAGNTINSTNDLNLNVINLSNNGHRIEIINLTVPQFQEEPFPLKSTINPKIVFA